VVSHIVALVSVGESKFSCALYFWSDSWRIGGDVLVRGRLARDTGPHCIGYLSSLPVCGEQARTTSSGSENTSHVSLRGSECHWMHVHVSCTSIRIAQCSVWARAHCGEKYLKVSVRNGSCRNIRSKDLMYIYQRARSMPWSQAYFMAS
jgi:hypothetical protein